MTAPGRLRFGRMAFYGSALLLWLVVLVSVLEAGARIWLASAQRATAAYAGEVVAWGLQAEQEVLDATADRAPVPPDTVRPRPDAPHRDTFFSLSSGAERQRFAEQRSELVVLCQADGVAGSLYPPPDAAGLAPLAARLKQDALLGELLEDGAQRQDLESALTMASAPGSMQMREYPLAGIQEGPSVLECFFQGFPAENSAVGQVAVFVRPAIYEELWYRIRPQVFRNDNYGNVVFWTNAHGFRDEEVRLPKPASVFRIVCIGGSTTFWGPRNDLTYPNLLEKKLREAVGTEQIDVVNAGVIGLTSSQERERFDDYLALEPDMILHYNYANDTDTVSAAAYALEREGIQTLKAQMRKSEFLRSMLAWQLTPSEGAFRTAMEESVTLDNMRHMCRRAKEAGVQMALSSFARPGLDHLSPEARRYFDLRFNAAFMMHPDIYTYVRSVDTYNARMEALAREEGARYVPLAEAYREGPGYFRDSCHMFLPGMDLKAEIMCRCLEEEVRQALAER